MREGGTHFTLDCLRESPLQIAQRSLQRRLADSNCCYLPEREVSVSAPLHGPRPFSTGAEKTPASGLLLQPGGFDPALASHLRDRCRAHLHPFVDGGVDVDASREGTPPDTIAVDEVAHADLLPQPSASRRDGSGSACDPRRSTVASDPSTRARRDTEVFASVLHAPAPSALDVHSRPRSRRLAQPGHRRQRTFRRAADAPRMGLRNFLLRLGGFAVGAGMVCRARLPRVRVLSSVAVRAVGSPGLSAVRVVGVTL